MKLSLMIMLIIVSSALPLVLGDDASIISQITTPTQFESTCPASSFAGTLATNALGPLTIGHRYLIVAARNSTGTTLLPGALTGIEIDFQFGFWDHTNTNIGSSSDIFYVGRTDTRTWNASTNTPSLANIVTRVQVTNLTAPGLWGVWAINVTDSSHQFIQLIDEPVGGQTPQMGFFATNPAVAAGVAFATLNYYCSSDGPTGSRLGPNNSTIIFDSSAVLPPTQSVLSGSTQCVASPFTNVLTWTSAANVTGYNLTRVNLDGSHTVFALGNVLTYTDNALVTNQTYSVHGWGAGGNAPESNSVTLQCPRQNLGQALIGGDSGQTLSQGYFGSPSYGSTAKILWGVLAVLTLGLALGMTVHPIMGYGGAIVGIIACFAFGWFPLWILLFLIVVGGGATLVWANYGRNQE